MDRADLTKAQRWEIADRLAEENLEQINNKCDAVNLSTHTFYLNYGKRIFDIIMSLLAIIVTFPINLAIGIITFFDVGRPIFFKQIRVGKDGKTFELIKFRNMRDVKDENGDLLHASLRVTKFGKFVRKTSLDELLNFWSVLKGDMSLIGPRPLVPEYIARYNKRHYARLLVRPGLECPPRNRGDNSHTWQEQFENDVWYVEHVSFLTDCKMLCNLVCLVIDRKVAVERASITAKGSFMGYSKDGMAINLEQVPQEYIDYYEIHKSYENMAV